MTLEAFTEVLMTSSLYWAGLYDERDLNKWQWLFQIDYAPAIGYGAKCMLATGKYTHVLPVVLH